MANIGATTAFYKVETSLTRANSEVSKSMERLATGKQNANAGDRSSYVAMADTFRLDYVGTKAGIKGASVVMGYLETGMRTLDAASALLGRMQELAVLGVNDTNTEADMKAIDAEAEALGAEFHRLLSKATYKGKDLFVASAGSEYVALGGRAANMTFGIEKIAYNNLFLHDYLEYAKESDAGKLSALDPILTDRNTATGKFNEGTLVNTSGADQTAKDRLTALNVKKVLDTRAVVEGRKYELIDEDGVLDAASSTDVDPLDLGGVASGSEDEAINDTTGADPGDRWTATKRGLLTGDAVAKQEGQLLFAASEGLFEIYGSAGDAVQTSLLSSQIEDVQKKVNTARVQAGSQYAALESAVTYTTDLTAQYELGFNTVNDVNFSMETAHLAKNQILQQAATAMLAQANSGQQSLLQLIQG
jgi:flagellin